MEMTDAICQCKIQAKFIEVFHRYAAFVGTRHTMLHQSTPTDEWMALVAQHDFQINHTH